MSIATGTPDDVRLNDPDADLVEALRRPDERALMTLVRHPQPPTMLRVDRSYVGPELIRLQGQAGRAAVDHATNGRAVALAKGGDRKQLAEGVAGHEWRSPGMTGTA